MALGSGAAVAFDADHDAADAVLRAAGFVATTIGTGAGVASSTDVVVAAVAGGADFVVAADVVAVAAVNWAGLEGQVADTGVAVR